jgi:inhibitor of cysteine peptidase
MRQNNDMKFNKLFTALFILAAVVQIEACTSTVRLRESDSGKSFNLRSGDQIEIVLAGNPTTGYVWQVKASKNGLIEKTDESYKSSGKLVGGGGEYTFKFRAKAKGDSDIKLIYSRPWEKRIEPAKIFAIKVMAK